MFKSILVLEARKGSAAVALLLLRAEFDAAFIIVFGEQEESFAKVAEAGCRPGHSIASDVVGRGAETKVGMRAYIPPIKKTKNLLPYPLCLYANLWRQRDGQENHHT